MAPPRRGHSGGRKVHASIPEDVLEALEVRRSLEGLNRSEAITEALRLWLSGKDDQELERRTRSAERLEELAELVDEQSRVMIERLDGQAERLAKMIERDRWATETLFAMLEHTVGPDLDRRRAREIAASTLRREAAEKSPRSPARRDSSGRAGI